MNTYLNGDGVVAVGRFALHRCVLSRLLRIVVGVGDLESVKEVPLNVGGECVSDVMDAGWLEVVKSRRWLLSTVL